MVEMWGGAWARILYDVMPSSGRGAFWHAEVGPTFHAYSVQYSTPSKVPLLRLRMHMRKLDRA